MTSSRRSNLIKVLIFGGLGLLLVWLSLKSVPFDVLALHFSSADYVWILVAMFIGLISHILRALRWNQLLNPLGYRIKFVNAMAAIMIGYLFNLAIPRSGEIARCGIVQTYDDVPIQTSIGTVVLERIIDLFFLALAFLLTFVFEYERIFAYAQENIFKPLIQLSENSWFGPMVVALILGGTAAVYFLFFRRRNAKKNKVNELISGFADGLKSVTKVKNPLLFFAYSAGIWMAYYLMLYVGFYAFDGLSSVSPSAALAVFSFGTVAMIITPGGIGAYPILIGNILALYEVSVGLGNSFGWIIWGAQTVLIILTGALSLFFLPIYNAKFVKS